MGKGGIKQRQSGEERRKGWDAKKSPCLCCILHLHSLC